MKMKKKGKKNKKKERGGNEQRGRKGEKRKGRFSRCSVGRSSKVREEKLIHASQVTREYQYLGVLSNFVR